MTDKTERVYRDRGHGIIQVSWTGTGVEVFTPPPKPPTEPPATAEKNP